VKVRITYGIDKLQEGATYHEQHILDDLLALSAKSLPEPKDGLPATDVKGVDTEYAKDGELLTLGFANATLASGLEFTGASTKAIASRSLRESAWLIGHNIPGDIDQLLRAGLPVREEWLQGKNIIDSFVLAKMLDENKPRGSYGLEALMLTNYNVQPWKAETDKKFAETGDARDWTPEQREARCRKDAWATFMLAKKFYPEIACTPRNKLLVETIHRISMTLYRIGLAGAKVDREYLTHFTSQNEISVSLLEEQLRIISLQHGWNKEQPFCPTKDDDIRHLMFELMGLEPIYKTANGLPAVDKTTLKQYKELPAIKTLLEFNTVQKLDSGYRDTASYLDEHGFLHMWINQLGARTGRRSSGGGLEGTPSSKNWQNATPAAKGMIVSRFPGGKIGAFDYKSLEPVLAAWIAQDGKLFDFFYEGNGYADVGKEIGVHVDKNDPSTPYRAIKSMTLGLFYNMQERLMAKNLWLGVGMSEPFRFSEDYRKHVEITGQYREKIVRAFRGLQRYWEKQKLDLSRNGFIVAPDGFVRHLPHNGDKTPKYWKLVNQAINFPVQHLASMVTGCAMVDAEAAMLHEYGLSYSEWQTSLHGQGCLMPTLINEVHDELTWDLPPKKDRDVRIILETMACPPTLRKLIPGFDISLKIEASVTDRWGAK
jgi:DNA polymerase I-like protein with 3'-5' exonuclease and polymerase domains